MLTRRSLLLASSALMAAPGKMNVLFFAVDDLMVIR